jgi:hypothetical protein
MAVSKKLVLFGSTLEEARNHFQQTYNNQESYYDTFEYNGKREYYTNGEYNDKNRLIWIPKYQYVFPNIVELIMQREPHEIKEVNYMFL